jgi:tetratricopeptide (TPR) repeat protein
LCGYEAHRRGDLPTAIAEFREAWRLNPQHVWARFLLAAGCLADSPREAEVHLSAVIEAQPEFYGAYLLRGIAHARLGEAALAEANFHEALVRTARSENAALRYAVLVFRGDVHTQRRAWPAAEADLNEAARLKPDGYLAASYLAQAYEGQRKFDEARAELNRALAASELSPEMEARLLLYRARLPNREPAAALDDVNRSLQLHPFAEAFVFLAEERLNRRPPAAKDLQAAIKHYDAALLSPAYSPAPDRVSRTHYGKARALIELRDYVQAAAALTKFLDAGGQPTAEICRLLGLIHADREEYQAATERLTQALRLEPGDAQTLAERGSTYLAIGARDLAEDDFNAALAADSTSARALAGRALIRALARDAAQAETDAERACRSGELTQRVAWLAARSFAVSFGHQMARGSLLSLDEGKTKIRYRQRAVELLEQSLALTPPDERAAFWRTSIHSDGWLRLLDGHPRYQELLNQYGTPKTAPAGGQ